MTQPEESSATSKGMIQILCSLVESFADAADICIDETRISLTADGKELGSRSVREILDRAKNGLDADRTSE